MNCTRNQCLIEFKTNFHLNQRVDSIKKIDDQWLAVTSTGTEILTPNIFIAGGVGSFEPRKPPIDGINKFENKGLSYSVINKDYYKDKKIVIFGGGDSALDWTVELAKIAKKIMNGEISIDEINENMFSDELSTSKIPDPELLIRTSGEKRISNFLLWQISYTELVFLNVLWPDFSDEHFEEAILEFNNRQRRLGMTSEQIVKQY